jgi:hypothetical protein
MASDNTEKQNTTINISRETTRKLIGIEETRKRSEHSALDLLEHGFHLGGLIHVSRDGLHERLTNAVSGSLTTHE